MAVGFTVDVEGRATEPVVLFGHVLLDEAAPANILDDWDHTATPPGDPLRTADALGATVGTPLGTGPSLAGCRELEWPH